MRRTTYKERAARMNVVRKEAFWLDGEAYDLIEYPLCVEVQPGQECDVEYPGETLVAPSEEGLWELWHRVLNTQHADWVWKKS